MSYTRTTRTAQPKAKPDRRYTSTEFRMSQINLLTSPAFVDLSPTAKAVYFILRLALPSHGLGCVVKRTFAVTVGCTPDDLEAALGELVHGGLLHRDRDDRVLWLRGFDKWLQGQIKGDFKLRVTRDANELPDDSPVVREFRRTFNIPAPVQDPLPEGGRDTDTDTGDITTSLNRGTKAVAHRSIAATEKQAGPFHQFMWEVFGDGAQLRPEEIRRLLIVAHVRFADDIDECAKRFAEYISDRDRADVDVTEFAKNLEAMAVAGLPF